MPRRKKHEEILAEPLPLYPDMNGAIRRLQSRRIEVNEATQQLIDKWIQQLNRMQDEIDKLQKIEQLNSALHQRGKTEESA